MSQYDTTTLVNIDSEDFVGYYDRANNPNGYTIRPDESKILPVFVAETLAKHLVDKLLQKQGIKDTMRNTPLRKDLFAKILPDLQKSTKDVKELPQEERIKALEEELKKTKEMVASLGGKAEQNKSEEPAKKSPQKVAK